MNTRAVRDACLKFAETTPSRWERVALCMVAFLAERDESTERCSLEPEADKAAVMARFVEGMEKSMAEMVDCFRGIGGVRPAAPASAKPGPLN
jgi:hypothetical protein